MLVVGIASTSFAAEKHHFESPFVGTYQCQALEDNYPTQFTEGFHSLSVLTINADHTLEADWYSFVDLTRPNEDVENQGTDHATWEGDPDQPSLIRWTQTTEGVDFATITTKHICLGQDKRDGIGYNKLKCIEKQVFDHIAEDTEFAFDHSFTFISSCER
ncbi:MAG: hypothetical protein NMNS01_03520 [Nitrosomonas sp.]|nr:MAG: hypothetical protein NMNS01_03520 [Nitrosomonas sp.]